MDFQDRPGLTSEPSPEVAADVIELYNKIVLTIGQPKTAEEGQRILSAVNLLTVMVFTTIPKRGDAVALFESFAVHARTEIANQLRKRGH